MNKKRLYVLFVLAFTCCTTTFAQHPYSRGGSPLYWAIVGAISAAIIYCFYWGIFFLSNLFKGKKNNTQNADVIEANSVEIATKESDKNQDSNDINSFTYEDTQQNDNTNKNDLGRDYSKKRHINFCGFLDSRIRRRMILSVIIYSFLLLVAVAVIESFITEKHSRLLYDMEEKVKRPFIGTDKEYVTGVVADKNINDIEFIEVPIPTLKIDQKENGPYLKNSNKENETFLTNIYSEIDHLYKFIYGGWELSGRKYSYNGYEYSKESSLSIIDFGYEPYMIGVPHGIEFNTQIAKTISEQCLMYDESCDASIWAIDSVLSYSNDYFVLLSAFNSNDSTPGNIPYYSETTGSVPIYDENGSFSGYYLSGMKKIGPYKIIFKYRNKHIWYVAEKGGFDASLRDRVLYYSSVFLILTSAFALLLFRTSRKMKTGRRLLIESLRERLLRYADPIKYLNAADSLKVAEARDISEKLLDTSINDFQVEEIADELREKLGINLITEQEKAYLIGLCKSFLKQKKKQLETKKLVNNLFVLIADTSKVGGKDYKTIQRIAFQIIEANQQEKEINL